MHVIRFFVALCLMTAACAAPAAARDVANCSWREPGGERALCHEAVIDAPISDVWSWFATSEGVRSWMAPVAAIDLGVGGALETSYNRDARLGDAGNIRNRVVAFAHEALLVIQVARAPPRFPHADAVRELTTVITFEVVDATHTRVRVAMLGYREGEAFDALYQFFDAGNAYTLGKLRERASNGPTDWTQEGTR
jgi:uncharacterized protein YndB with AHSA1/START domain